MQRSFVLPAFAEAFILFAFFAFFPLLFAFPEKSKNHRISHGIHGFHCGALPGFRNTRFHGCTTPTITLWWSPTGQDRTRPFPLRFDRKPFWLSSLIFLVFLRLHRVFSSGGLSLATFWLTCEVVCMGPVGPDLWELIGPHGSMLFWPSLAEHLVHKKGHLKT